MSVLWELDDYALLVCGPQGHFPRRELRSLCGSTDLCVIQSIAVLEAFQVKVYEHIHVSIRTC